MRINKITIRNFKGFDYREVEFRNRLTVVIGNNTAGKTTLLKAIQVGLGAYLQSLEQLPGGTMYRRNFSSLDIYKKFDSAQRDYLKNIDDPEIHIEAAFPIIKRAADGSFENETRQIHWSRSFKGSYTTHTRECAGQLIDTVKEIESHRAEGCILPLVLSFGAKRTSDSQAKITTKVKERVNRMEKAYRYCLHDKVDFDGATEWLARYDKDLRDKKNFEGNREAYFDALAEAIPALSDIELDGKEIEAVVSVTGHEPSRHHFSYMSDGLQSMINIVSEIAHRCIELNGFLGRNAVKETPGIVLIDEVDIYLHPHWQKHVLQDLMRAFPKIQFVVTTHSPFIVQSLDENQLISFDENILTEGTPYQESLEDITEKRMGLEQNIRSEKFQQMVKAAAELFEAVDCNADNQDELHDRLTRLEAEFSENPAYLALVRAEFKSKTAEK